MSCHDMEKNKPLVSVLISAYNAESFLIPTIYSVLNQKYKMLEVLILDDNSKDNTYNLRSQITDSRVHRFQWKVSRGPYGWLNFLLEKAKGDYIAIQDHDDFWHPDKIQKQVQFLEQHLEYIWCGTKTLMRYESDQKWFEYFLWMENYYTIHPSLVFRNKWQRYPTDSVYMNDALFQKTILCQWEKIIYNINETLTMHRIKDGASNFSYKRFLYTWGTMNTIFILHPIWYGICIVLRETMRKIIYPILSWIGKWKRIDVIERIPFRLMGNKMGEYNKQKISFMGF